MLISEKKLKRAQLKRKYDFRNPTLLFFRNKSGRWCVKSGDISLKRALKLQTYVKVLSPESALKIAKLNLTNCTKWPQLRPTGGFDPPESSKLPSIFLSPFSRCLLSVWRAHHSVEYQLNSVWTRVYSWKRNCVKLRGKKLSFHDFFCYNDTYIQFIII